MPYLVVSKLTTKTSLVCLKTAASSSLFLIKSKPKHHNIPVMAAAAAAAAASSTSSSKPVFVDDVISASTPSVGSGFDFLKPNAVFFSSSSSSLSGFRSASLRFGRGGKGRGLVSGSSGFDGEVLRKSGSGRVSVFWKRTQQSFSSSPVVGASCFASAGGDRIVDSTLVTGQKLKLLSGSCYMPHPAKEETGGEDAHFICEDEQVIAVADGVGGWAEVGINAGEYSRELMSNSVKAIGEENKDAIDPARVLEKAHLSTKSAGSSTACVIALTNEGIHAINLGDSGFIVVRHGSTIFQSPVQQHSFNFTYQLANAAEGDLPSSGQVFRIPVAPGDVIVAGTDGLFDNLYNNEVAAIVVQSVQSGAGPQVTAQKIAALARERAGDRNRQTPFAASAQEAGFRYYGGKMDDITVVVSYITSAISV